jgi:hypothetical protein
MVIIYALLLFAILRYILEDFFRLRDININGILIIIVSARGVHKL